MLLFAVLRAIEVIGEAASLPIDSVGVNMRNRLIHGYFDVYADVVWKTVTHEILPLHRGFRQLLPESKRFRGP
jgi:uncharacterized protein with HEPN domain